MPLPLLVLLMVLLSLTALDEQCCSSVPCGTEDGSELRRGEPKVFSKKVSRSTLLGWTSGERPITFRLKNALFSGTDNNRSIKTVDRSFNKTNLYLIIQEIID